MSINQDDVKPGDTVTVELKSEHDAVVRVTGPVWEDDNNEFRIGWHYMMESIGERIIDHQPAEPEQPEWVDALVVRDGNDDIWAEIMSNTRGKVWRRLTSGYQLDWCAAEIDLLGPVTPVIDGDGNIVAPCDDCDNRVAALVEELRQTEQVRDKAERERDEAQQKASKEHEEATRYRGKYSHEVDLREEREVSLDEMTRERDEAIERAEQKEYELQYRIKGLQKYITASEQDRHDVAHRAANAEQERDEYKRSLESTGGGSLEMVRIEKADAWDQGKLAGLKERATGHVYRGQNPYRSDQ